MAPAVRLAAGRPVSRHPVAGGHGAEAAAEVNAEPYRRTLNVMPPRYWLALVGG